MSSSRKRLAGSLTSKQRRVGCASNSSSARTNESGIATMSRSASMQSAGFVSPKGKSSSLGESEQHEEDHTETGSKPKHVWLGEHALADFSRRELTTLSWCSAMKRTQFVNL
jgi:hypothetical protein